MVFGPVFIQHKITCCVHTCLPVSPFSYCEKCGNIWAFQWITNVLFNVLERQQKVKVLFCKCISTDLKCLTYLCWKMGDRQTCRAADRKWQEAFQWNKVLLKKRILIYFYIFFFLLISLRRPNMHNNVFFPCGHPKVSVLNSNSL